MSLAFQKLQGDGTTAYNQLQKMTQMLEALEELNFPDIWKIAKMFAPDVALIPVFKTWFINDGQDNSSVGFDGTYFGVFQISHYNLNVARSNNGQTSSETFLMYGGERVFSSHIVIHGDDVLTIPSKNHVYTGYADSLFLSKVAGVDPNHRVYVSFYGFRLGDAIFTPVDTSPDNMEFAAVDDAELSTVYTSAPYTVQGLDVSQDATIVASVGSNGMMRINGGEWTTEPQTVMNGDVIELQVTSSDQPGTESSVSLTVGTETTDFVVSTTASPLVEYTLEYMVDNFSYYFSGGHVQIILSDSSGILQTVDLTSPESGQGSVTFSTSDSEVHLTAVSYGSVPFAFAVYDYVNEPNFISSDSGVVDVTVPVGNIEAIMVDDDGSTGGGGEGTQHTVEFGDQYGQEGNYFEVLDENDNLISERVYASGDGQYHDFVFVCNISTQVKFRFGQEGSSSCSYSIQGFVDGFWTDVDLEQTWINEQGSTWTTPLLNLYDYRVTIFST